MPLVLKAPKSAASNKPSKDLQAPDPDLFITKTSFENGRTIWSTFPQPDKVRIVGYLLPEHFLYNGPLAASPAFLENQVIQLFEGLKGSTHIDGPAAYFQIKFKVFFRANLKLGYRGANLHIEAEKVKEAGSAATGYRVSLDFNPRKIGIEGCKQLHATFDQAAQQHFDFGQFLRDAKITQMDVAVDYSDVMPAELIVTATTNGKRAHYRGTDGVLETVYVHRAFKLPSEPVKKPQRLGKLIASIYDRNRERAVWGKQPPYPGRQITRLEANLSNQKLKLVTLSDLKNPFADIRLSYAAAIAFSDRKL